MRQLKITQQITVRDTASLSKYLSEVSGIQSGGLSAQEECDIAAEIQNPKTTEERKKELIKKLTEGNLRFVISVAKQYQRQNNIALELGDLINLGNLGMVKAAERFDHTRGFKFISYAVWWIRQSILQGTADHRNTVRMPLNKIGLQNKISRISSALEQHLERIPTEDEIALALAVEDEKQSHLTGSDIRDIVIKGQSSFSVDGYIQQDDRDTRFVDSMESSGLDELQSLLRNKDLRFELDRLMNKLHPTEKQVLTSFFGMDGAQKTLEEIGEEIGKTRERARQIKESALKKLKSKVGRTTLHEYL